MSKQIVEAIKILNDNQISIPSDAIDKVVEYIDQLESHKCVKQKSSGSILSKDELSYKLAIYVTRFINDEWVSAKDALLCDFIKWMKNQDEEEDE